VSCGGGNYDKQWVTTTSPTPGGTACPSPSFYDNAGNSCNTQSCCTSHSYSQCNSIGDYHWFNSCHVQEDQIDSCDMKCMDTGPGTYRCVECLNDNDCSATHVCDDGNCIIAPQSCTSNSDCSLSEVCDTGACREETCNDVGLGSTTFISTGHSRCVLDYVQHDQIAGSNNQLICWGVASLCNNGCESQYYYQDHCK